MGRFWKIIAGLVGGLIVSVLGLLVFGLIAGTPEGSIGTVVFLVIWGLALVMAILSQSVGKAWRKMFFVSAALSFALPLATLIFSGRSAVEAGSGSEVAGAIIGGGIATIFTGFVGFFLGVVFLILGFLTGRGPVEIRVVETVKVTDEKDTSS